MPKMQIQFQVISDGPKVAYHINSKATGFYGCFYAIYLIVFHASNIHEVRQ
jgi:hypothetical protein